MFVDAELQIRATDIAEVLTAAQPQLDEELRSLIQDQLSNADSIVRQWLDDLVFKLENPGNVSWVDVFVEDVSECGSSIDGGGTIQFAPSTLAYRERSHDNLFEGLQGEKDLQYLQGWFHGYKENLSSHALSFMDGIKAAIETARTGSRKTGFAEGFALICEYSEKPIDASVYYDGYEIVLALAIVSDHVVEFGELAAGLARRLGRGTREFTIASSMARRLSEAEDYSSSLKALHLALVMFRAHRNGFWNNLKRLAVFPVFRLSAALRFPVNLNSSATIVSRLLVRHARCLINLRRPDDATMYCERALEALRGAIPEYHMDSACLLADIGSDLLVAGLLKQDVFKRERGLSLLIKSIGISIWNLRCLRGMSIQHFVVRHNVCMGRYIDAIWLDDADRKAEVIQDLKHLLEKELLLLSKGERNRHAAVIEEIRRAVEAVLNGEEGVVFVESYRVAA